jgi:predicted dithiol-disulfide oxidoreductase (DUF899 family)
MTYAATRARLKEYRAEIAAIREKMRKEQAAVEPQDVKDYAFQTVEGEVRLSQLFGDKNDLIVIHNMGTTCPACTMWADGFNGVYQHLASRAAFVLTTPDAPKVQRQFAGDRGWRFPIVSHKGTTFSADMGFSPAEGKFWPGVSVFQKRNGKIVRVSDQELGPHDDFCSVCHFFDMIPEGVADFRPKFRYFQAEGAR